MKGTPEQLALVFVDSEIARDDWTFNPAWLGFRCGKFNDAGCGELPNNNAYYGGAEPPWVTSATMAYISGSTLFYSSGDAFHDSTSLWGANKITLTTVLPGTCSMAASSSTLTCSSNPFDATMVGVKISVVGSASVNSSVATYVNSGTVTLANAAGSAGITSATVTVSPTYKIVASGSWTQTCGTYCYTGAGTSVVTQIPLTIVAADTGTIPCTGLMCGSSGTPSSFTLNAPSIMRKNPFEMKEGQRILFSGNIAGNADFSGGQRGVCASFGIRNTSGSGPNATNYQSTIQDLTVVDSVFNNCGNGISMGGRSTGISGVSRQSNRLSFTNILQQAITLSNPGDGGGNGIGYNIGSGHQTWTATVTQTTSSVVTLVATHSNDGNCDPSTGSGVPPTGCGGHPLLPGLRAPPASVYVCKYGSFDMPTYSSGSNILAFGVGPLAITGSAPYTTDGAWTPANVTITYPWPASPTCSSSTNCVGASDTSCTFSNIEGGPQNLSITHNLLASDAVEPLGQGPTVSNGAVLMQSFTVQDSIFMGQAGATKAGWYDSAANPITCSFGTQEGCSTELFNYDETTMTARSIAFPGRTGANAPANGQYIAFYGPPGTSPPNCGATYSGGAAYPAGGGSGPAAADTDSYFPTNSCAGIGFNCTDSTPNISPRSEERRVGQ